MDLSKKTVPELQAICKQKGIILKSKKRKDDIIKLIKEYKSDTEIDDKNDIIKSLQELTINQEIEYEKKEDIPVEIQQITKDILSENFTKCVKGYHIINDDPIKESVWEDINAQVLNSSGCNIITQSKGSHKSGTDLLCSIGALSNKSTQYDIGNKSFKLSSYRLTTVCSDKSPGKIEDIITEINHRKNFEFYTIIVRNEEEKEFQYDWYLIPSNYPQFNPSSYKWVPKVGKQGTKKDSVIGWETNMIEGSKMSITFSMSSQLWLDIIITKEMEQFIIASCKVNKGRKLDYIQLYNKEMGI